MCSCYLTPSHDSIWLYQCQQTFAIGHAQSGKNPELRLIFFRLARLFRLPIIPIFVFDGPSRPALKRGKKVLPLEHWLSQGARHFIDAFGFEWMMAPAEAEAELARLNARGLINSVLTDDSDAFIFGATTIIRNPNVKVDKDHVGIYSADAIRTQIDPALTRGSLYLVAILSGGDYDDGLLRCGAEIARSLARYGLGDTLLAAVTSRHVDLPSFLHGWRSELKTYLSEDPRDTLGVATSLSLLPFPTPFRILSYLRPMLGC
ncbi:Flap endonuclease GEN 1 [Grifola frondosa]|uniref:Flap endonuclease GEN 1 n=1 Tax=Grifola frondosa TaxID=5627 RepID=A0A1C7MB18_GRIFR|nr:Flap endonuclease GEN 1 [Grifola frondosa]